MSCLLLDSNVPAQLAAAVARLRADEPVALPSETVYGLAGRLYSEPALAKIFALKARPRFDPLIVHVLDKAAGAAISLGLNPLEEKLIDAFWPGPLTILLKKQDFVTHLCTAGSPWVAVRAPSHPVFRRVLEELGEPLCAPSANRFGRVSPTSSRDVVAELGPYGLGAVVEGGSCEHGVESTIVRVNENVIELLRPGAISVEQLVEASGGAPVRNIKVEKDPEKEALLTPGSALSHYAPRTPVLFVEDYLQFGPKFLASDFQNCALLEVFPSEESSWDSWAGAKERVTLSPRGSDLEAASVLFATLRGLDAEGFDAIVALRGPDEGLGLAVNDRLRRAASRRLG